MASVLEVADNIYEIKPDDPGRGIPCSCYLVVDDQIALVETGASSQLPEILAGMAKLGYDANSLSYVIPTHIHADHAGGVGHLVRYSSRPRVVVHEQGAAHLIDPLKLISGIMQIFGENFEDELGALLPVPEHRILVVHNDETVVLGERRLKILYSPGHSPHHICIFDSKSEGLFCGEALGVYLPLDNVLMLATAPPIFELALAMDTIDRLQQLDPKILFFSQWGASRETHRLIELSREYTKSTGDSILQAIKAGDREDVIARRLQSPMMDSRYLKSRKMRHILGTFTIRSYMAYFRREGLV